MQIRQLKEWYLKTLKLPVGDADLLDENEALGVDSVDAVVLANAIERDFGVVIETVAQGRRAFSSLSGLAAFLEEAGDAGKEERPVDEAPAVSDSRYTITPVRRENAQEVAALFRAIYGEEFPVKYVYHGDQVMREI